MIREKALDYVAKINDTVINIEVNNNSDYKVMERNMDYANRLYSSKVKRSKEYEYNQVIQLNINNFSFKENDKIIDIYKIQNDEGIMLNNKLIFIQIYIPNLRKKWYTLGIEKLDARERYILALVEENIKDVEKFGDEKVMREYISEAEKANHDRKIEK